MQFAGFSIDHFGMFQDFPLTNIGPGLTVMHGGNGTGKTTLVHFLRGILFGFDAPSVSIGFRDAHSAGHLDADSFKQRLRFRRRAQPAGAGGFDVMDRVAGSGLPEHSNRLPAWVTEDVFQEIFSVGPQEAERFDLLTRLCLNGPLGGDVIESEIRRSETALAQAVCERMGDGSESGLVQKIAQLKLRWRTLNDQLTAMRQASPQVSVRISEIEHQLGVSNETTILLTGQIQDLRSEIERLEERRRQLLQRNTLTLDREPIQAEIDRLTERLEQWTSVKSSIERQGIATSSNADGRPHTHESLRSARALVSRLEQRLEDLERAGHTSGDRAVGTLHAHLREEVYSLCDHIAKHESAVVANEQGLEALFAARALQNIGSLQDVLRGRQECLRAELLRADNILGIDCWSDHVTDCELDAHRRFQRSGSDGTSLQQAEARLHALRLEREELIVQRDRNAEQVPALERELEEQRRQLISAARLEDIDRLNADIAENDAHGELLQSRLSVLEQTEAHLQEVVARLKQQRQPAVLELAADYLRRLTEGECTAFGVAENRTGLTIYTRRAAQPLPLNQMSRGTCDQVALALRLALIQMMAVDHERVPLILDDVFITADDDRAEAAADLLMEVAESGQQIVLLTSQNDVRELFVRRHAAIRSLEGEPSAPPQSVIAPAPAPDPIPVPESALPDESLVFKACDGQAEEFPGELAERVVAESGETDAKWLFYLEVDNPVEDLADLTVAEIAALQATGIQTVDDLICVAADELEERFRREGFLIDGERILAWQAQAEMSCRVPLLRRRDAALLYAAGIRSVEQLSRLRPEAVYELLTSFQHSEAGTHYRRAGRGIDRQQAINWTRWALHSRSMADARRHRHEYHARTRSGLDSPGSRSANATTQIARRTGPAESSVCRQRRPRISSESQRTRSERFSRRRRRMERKTDRQRTTRGSARLSGRDHSSRGVRNSNRQDSETGGGDWKFYLSRSSDVESAPSIGPRTADRLAKVNIITVDDLLNASPETVVARLNNRRISVEVIEQWQAQAALVCQIPQLRGHDAQILVACGYAEAEEVAAQNAADLFAEVAPFCSTAEGARIVRGGTRPNLAEVTEWINWAQNSRSLKAA